MKREAELSPAFDRTLLMRLWPYVRPHRVLLWGSAILTPLVILFELAQPYCLKYAIEHHIAVNRLNGLGLVVLVYAGLVLAAAGANYFEQLVVQQLGQRAMHSMRCAVYDHVLAQRTRFFDTMPVGRLMTRMTNDIESLSEMFSQGVVSLLADFAKMIVIVGIMFYLSPELTLLTLTTLPFLWLLVRYARNTMRRSFREIRVRLAAMNSYAQEHLQGVRVVQLLRRETTARREFDEINAAHRDAYHSSIRADAMMYAWVDALGTIARALVVWWVASAYGGSVESVARAADVAMVAAFVEYIYRFFVPIRDLSAKYAVMQGAMAAMERLNQLLETRDFDGIDTEARPALPRSTPTDDALAFHKVSFRYGHDWVLRDIDFAVPRGATVAVVGATGSGKSTLIKLMARLYECTAGDIFLGGASIRSLPLATLRQRVTIIAQDAHMFRGTLRDNIAMGVDVPDAELSHALAQVGLDALLARRGHSLDMQVGERGSNLSAGEKQLIAFCRALVRKPEILVLDEATANVDPAAEQLVERGCELLMRGRTTLVIAHRLSTIRNANVIVVLDKGRIVEMGTHAELVALRGVYFALEHTFFRAAGIASPTDAQMLKINANN